MCVVLFSDAGKSILQERAMKSNSQTTVVCILSMLPSWWPGVSGARVLVCSSRLCVCCLLGVSMSLLLPNRCVPLLYSCLVLR
jgi:hypothetical protein